MVRTSRLRVVLIVCGLLTPFPAFANPWNIPAPNLPARAFVLIEAQSGTELAAVNADERLPPASLTKLMTAYLLFGDLRAGKLKLDEHVTVSRTAARLPGARMFLREGDSVPVEDLFKGMLVQSGNDATFALVERASGTLPVFVTRMNAMAAELGLANTHFANATGLNNPQHYSSARDLTRLALAVQHDFPEYAGWFALQEYRWAGMHSRTATRCCATPVWTGSRPATPRPPVIAWWRARNVTACASSPPCSAPTANRNAPAAGAGCSTLVSGSLRHACCIEAMCPSQPCRSGWGRTMLWRSA
ncbi:MAG: D-alanyl-D-alanine carboxypeptidase [Proteobacteria bacterium]|nr:D-alanyl-D-alanine carboxypeptidase [Pseudomonadota bacterium]